MKVYSLLCITFFTIFSLDFVKLFLVGNKACLRSTPTSFFNKSPL